MELGRLIRLQALKDAEAEIKLRIFSANKISPQLQKNCWMK
jgi:hypothetical protein